MVWGFIGKMFFLCYMKRVIADAIQPYKGLYYRLITESSLYHTKFE